MKLEVSTVAFEKVMAAKIRKRLEREEEEQVMNAADKLDKVDGDNLDD